MKLNTIPYATKLINDTDAYAVVIDSRFGFVATEAEARLVMDTACPEDIGSSAHGHIAILRPRGKDVAIDNDKPHVRLSTLQAIDILGFAQKRGPRVKARFRHRDPMAGLSYLPVRLDRYKARKASKSLTFEEWLDLDIPSTYGRWTLENAQANWLLAVPQAELSKYSFNPLDH